MTNDALARPRAKIKSGEKVICPTSPSIWRYLSQAGKLPPGTLFHEPGQPTWYIDQNGPGAEVRRRAVAEVGEGPAQ